MHSNRSTTLVVATLDELNDVYPPNKSGNHVGMRAFITEAAEGEPVVYDLGPVNEAEASTGLRWIPGVDDPGPYYY